MVQESEAFRLWRQITKNSAERAIQSESSDGSADDFQYGSRKCFHSAGIQRKMYQCCDSMRIRNPLYRRRISCDCIWRSGSLRGRRCRKLYLPSGVAGFTALTALSDSEDPEKASIPFDKDRNGFVLGEGAGIVMLEELEHAKKRGARIYAEVVGYGATGDAYHITSPAENGEGAGMAMKLAMEEAGAQPEQIDYINAHGTSTHHNDLYETRAIRYALGAAADQVVVNSTKSIIGHLLGAAGGVEFVTCVKSIQDGFIHQTMGTKETEEECSLDYAIGAPVEKEITYALTNSLGFGGHNASLLLKKYEG